MRKLTKGDNLFSDGFSHELDQYRGYVVADINANTDTLSFTNGVELFVGEANGDVNEAALRRIQIREASSQQPAGIGDRAHPECRQ